MLGQRTQRAAAAGRGIAAERSAAVVAVAEGGTAAAGVASRKRRVWGAGG